MCSCNVCERWNEAQAERHTVDCQSDYEAALNEKSNATHNALLDCVCVWACLDEACQKVDMYQQLRCRLFLPCALSGLRKLLCS